VTRIKLAYRTKVHLFFGGGLLLALAVGLATSLFSGLSLWSSIFGAFRQIRPVEYIMFALFWYWFARGQRTNSRPTLTTLNLSGSKT
jgi:hypothetical protein